MWNARVINNIESLNYINCKKSDTRVLKLKVGSKLK